MNCSLDWRLSASTPHRAKQPRETKGIHLNPKPNIHQCPNDDIPKIPIFISRKHSLNEKSLTSMKSSLVQTAPRTKPSYILSFLYFLFDLCELTYLHTAQSSLYFGSSGSSTAQCACEAACPGPYDLLKVDSTIPRYAYMRTYTIAFREAQTRFCCIYSL